MQNKPRKSNENNFMVLLNFIVDPAVIVDEKGHILLVNNALEDLTGFSKKEVIGKSFLEMSNLTAESKAILLKNLMKRMQGLPLEPYEINFTDKTGKARYAEVKAKKIDYVGQPADLVMFRDITRRKENARRLKEYSEKMEALVNEKVKEVKESEERYRELTESINNVFFAMDKDLKYTYWNKASEKLTGILAKDAIGKHLTEVFPNVKGTKVEQFYKQVLRTKQPQSFVNKYRLRDKDFIFEISAYPTMDGLSVFVKDITESKKAEEALRASEKYLEEILSSVLTGVVIIDEKTHQILDANPNALETIGTSKEHVIGKVCHRFICPAEKGKCPISDLGQTVDRSERVLLRASGERIPILKTVTTTTWRGHKYLIESFIDITEQKKAEAALKESEEKYRELINGMNDTAWVIDFDGNFVDVNDAAVKVLGYSREELRSMGPPDIDNSLTKEQIRDLIRSMPADQIQVFETAHTTKDGKMIPVEISSSLVTYQGKQAILSIARDITERKKMEDALKQERDMLESVTENVGAGLAIISEDYRILWANKLLKQMGDIENKICYSTFNTIDTVCPDCGVKKVFETGVPFDSHEYRCPFEKGKDRWIELIVTPIKDKNGAVIAALELSIDITEKKLMQNKLAEYSQKLEKIVEKKTEQLKQTQAKLVKSERLATIGELAAMVGHDLRNPLTGIMGAAYYLKAKHGTEISAKGKEMLETIEKAINYSNKIINDLLEYSRDLKLEFTETTPKVMLQSALSLLEVPEKIQVIDAAKDKPMVKADTERIRNVFVRIIQNAIDAMPEGGTLTIKSRKVRDKLEIAFKDTGAGMSEETLSKLKGGVPLFTTKSKGMGFGLPICKRIAEAHGGKLSVESTAGKGTTVTVTIPVNPEPVDEGEEKWIFSESMLSAIITAKRAP